MLMAESESTEWNCLRRVLSVQQCELNCVNMFYLVFFIYIWMLCASVFCLLANHEHSNQACLLSSLMWGQVDHSGHLGYTEFLYLWRVLRSWKVLTAVKCCIYWTVLLCGFSVATVEDMNGRAIKMFYLTKIICTTLKKDDR